MQVGLTVVEKINKQCNIDELDTLKERMEEQQFDMEEKQDFFVKAGQVENAEELLNELDELEADLVHEELEQVQAGIGKLNIHPGNKAPQAAKTEDQELEELEKLMS